MEPIFLGSHSGNSSSEQGQSLYMERRVAAPSAICASALIECELEQEVLNSTTLINIEPRNLIASQKQTGAHEAIFTKPTAN